MARSTVRPYSAYQMTGRSRSEAIAGRRTAARLAQQGRRRGRSRRPSTTAPSGKSSHGTETIQSATARARSPRPREGGLIRGVRLDQRHRDRHERVAVRSVARFAVPPRRASRRALARHVPLSGDSVRSLVARPMRVKQSSQATLRQPRPLPGRPSPGRLGPAQAVGSCHPAHDLADAGVVHHVAGPGTGVVLGRADRGDRDRAVVRRRWRWVCPEVTSVGRFAAASRSRNSSPSAPPPRRPEGRLGPHRAGGGA